MIRREGEREKQLRKIRSDKKKQLRPWLPGTLLAEMKSLKKFLNEPSLAATLESVLNKTLINRSFIDYVKPSMYRTISLPVSSDGAYRFTLIANENIECMADELYKKIKEGITKRASFFVTRNVVENYIHPLTSGLNISADGLATIALDYAVKCLLPSIAPGYKNKYHASSSNGQVRKTYGSA
ncbi:hypothetical protein [Brevibacillus agri]|uniref:hypothetical protein n=1 Tax=Brevibacillus agri TaxID=51101 RepID=UPI0018CDA435|nr:hypothetical protein [Brevibacillus agri]MBG9568451.1 hypothetical protein [Brevibacillus agri]